MIDELVQRFGQRARPDEPMSRHTTFRIGGPADVLIDVETVDELRDVLTCGLPVTIIGRGANVLVADVGIRGVVVRLTGAFRDMTFSDDASAVTVGAGASLGRLVAECVKRRRNTFSWAAGIPGTIGGALLMNAGSWGHAMGEFVTSLTVMDPQGKIQVLVREGVTFEYRRATLPVPDAVICGVTLALPMLAADEKNPETLKAHYLAQKLRTQPLKDASAGCVFRNPEGRHAGVLIEEAGCKGLRVGGAVVSDRHANYIVNDGDATADDVLKLIATVRGRVEAHAGVTLEMELRLLPQQHR